MNDQILMALGRFLVDQAVQKESVIRRMMDLEKENENMKAASGSEAEKAKG